MDSGRFRFDAFVLDPAQRRLTRDGVPVALNGRYLDALALLVRARGGLVSKDRFLGEVWAGVPVTDEALTQCVRTLRKALDDDAARPRFIATVPKHGYRFVAPVAEDEAEAKGPAPAPAPAPKPGAEAPAAGAGVARLGSAGALGGGAAGAVGGLAYGFVSTAPGAGEAGAGALSVLLVLAGITLLLGLVGGAGVAFGAAVAGRRAAGSGPWRREAWSVAGGAAGGLAVGAVVKLFGLDAFTLLLGRGPGDITGAMEGALLGAAVGLGAGADRRALRRGLALAGLAGGVAGGLVPLLGGRLLGGSLDLLVRHFPGARLRLDPIGALLGETGFGPLSQSLTGALEGALFCAGVAGAMIWARRPPPQSPGPRLPDSRA